jgi:hypothetical protein
LQPVGQNRGRLPHRRFPLRAQLNPFRATVAGRFVIIAMVRFSPTAGTEYLPHCVSVRGRFSAHFSRTSIAGNRTPRTADFALELEPSRYRLLPSGMAYACQKWRQKLATDWHNFADSTYVNRWLFGTHWKNPGKFASLPNRQLLNNRACGESAAASLLR